MLSVLVVLVLVLLVNTTSTGPWAQLKAQLHSLFSPLLPPSVTSIAIASLYTYVAGLPDLARAFAACKAGARSGDGGTADCVFEGVRALAGFITLLSGLAFVERAAEMLRIGAANGRFAWLEASAKRWLR